MVSQSIPYETASEPVKGLRGASSWVAIVANLILPPAAIFGGIQVLVRHLRSMKYARNVDQLITDGQNAIKIAKEKDEESDRRGGTPNGGRRVIE